MHLLWQTGKPFFEKAKSVAAKFSNIKIHEFIYDMGKAYRAADAIVSRAGAIAISELCLIGKPVILVPFPHATGNHQYKNAMALVKHKAALLVEDKHAKDDLVSTLLELIQDANRMHDLSSQN